MNLTRLIVFIFAFGYIAGQTVPSTSLAQAALTDFLNLFNPLTKLGKCLFINRTLKQIALDDTTLSVTTQLASLVYSNFLNLVKLLQSGQIVISDESAPFVSPLPVASYLDEELRYSEFIDILYLVLNEFFHLKPGTVAAYSGTVQGCTGTVPRINKDSPGNCTDDDYSFYQIQGACLNPANHGAGLADRAMTRIGDPICTLDDQVNICKLPSARSLSLAIASILDGEPADKKAFVPNNLVLSFSQFIVHETSQAQFMGSPLGENATAACASDKRGLSKFLSSPAVDTIDIDCTDPFYKKFEVKCLNFIRNRVLNENCTIQKSNFLNAATPIMDLNTLYQRLNKETRQYESLMDADGKLLKDSNGRFVIGHTNNIQHSLVAVVHLLFANMHDLIVDELKGFLSPSNAFKVARKINVAMYQQIWYNDVLVEFIGTNNTIVNSEEDSFDSDVVPQIMQEYSAAAGRFPHVFVPDDIVLADCSNFAQVQRIPLRNTYGNEELAQSQFKQLVCGGISQQWRTAGISADIQNFLFFNKDHGYGEDLLAIDALRNRDACIEPYINYQRRINRACIKNWNDLRPFFSDDAINVFKKLYQNVGDLELYPAGLVEDFVGDSKMGTIFTYITMKQFEMIKAGDPKFFTHSLSDAQFDEIRKMTFTKFICIAAKLTNGLKDMRFGFIKKSNDITKCKCKTLKDCLNLKVFVE